MKAIVAGPTPLALRVEIRVQSAKALATAAIAAIYVATELWQVAMRPSSMIGIRLAVYALVFLAALSE
ncbi:hypothetical protein ACEN8K_24475, partial [Variovorax sp. CT11-76]